LVSSNSSIFFGDSTVFFGFVGSTGGSSNIHRVCFNSISFVANLLDDETICAGESVRIDAKIPSGVTYHWSPVLRVSNPSISNPNFTPTVSTNYKVTIEDVCGEETELEIIIDLTTALNAGILSTTITSICVAGTSKITSTGAAEGVWTSSDVTVATINTSTGILTGAASGITDVFYEVTGSGACKTIATTDIIVKRINK
jgi:hypothetical protein